MTTLTAKITTSIVARLTSALDLANNESAIAKSYVEEYDDGTGANQAQQHFSDTRTLAGSAAESLDLAGGLAAPLGGSITFTAIKEIIIKAADANAGNLRVGRVVANCFAGPFDQTAGSLGVTIPPGACHRFSNPGATGWAVTGATADLLRVENLDAGACSYDIILIGEGTAA